MQNVTTLEDATNVLLLYAPEKRQLHYDLSTMKQLMGLFDNPQNSLKVIHVAGTSGKTSTCYYVRALLEEGGQKTGLTVSPHIVSINERVQISGQPLNEKKFISYLESFMKVIETSDINPSYYELTMAFAYYVFEKERVDYAVIETGLGGLLDGSNVVDRTDKLCVIQRIGYDHTEILGESLQEIALQKAGIIQQHNDVLVLEQAPDILDIITNYAQQKEANFHLVTEQHHDGILVAFQHANWSMAIAVYDFLMSRDTLPTLSNGSLARAQLITPPGRYETRQYKQQTIIFDGAHNPQKLEAFLQSLPHSVKKPTIVFSLKDTDNKKIDECMETISAYGGLLVITSFVLGQDNKNITSVPLARLLASAEKYHVVTVVKTDPKDALDYAVNHGKAPFIVTGSLYLVSQLRHFTQD